MNTIIVPIDREGLRLCAFRTHNQKFTAYQVRERDRQLYLAMLLGNNFCSKVRIVFNTFDGMKEVCSIIWATTEKFVLLKGGSTIPLEAIVTVDIDAYRQSSEYLQVGMN